ncbi:hypothetical protein [Rhizobium leguminosarum]|uniref:hypothetical protein n=1 Tax=Rhizobium leguminosarum TaxID=384 RepID=UPI001C9215D8|nr:hypothetical protein [Rhizobium leguminosarum]MBY2988680.1 hypothetical protein [Rhizobium leguminosarum]
MTRPDEIVHKDDIAIFTGDFEGFPRILYPCLGNPDLVSKLSRVKVATIDDTGSFTLHNNKKRFLKETERCGILRSGLSYQPLNYPTQHCVDNWISEVSESFQQSQSEVVMFIFEIVEPRPDIQYSGKRPNLKLSEPLFLLEDERTFGRHAIGTSDQ